MLGLVAKGLANSEIGEALFVSESTVKTHVSHILTKLQLRVDDQAMVRGGLRLILEAEDDINVIAEAENGEEGVRLARRETPDVVLKGVHTPVMDGR